MKEERLYALVDQELRGELLEEGRSELDRWLGQDSANQAVYDEVRTLLGIAETAVNGIATETDSQWESLWASISETETEAETTEAPVIELAGRSKPRRWMGIAAAIVLLATIGVFFVMQNTGSSSIGGEMAEISVPLKENGTFQLPDGSKVTLNADSRLRLADNFNDSERRVVLEGEAFFDVARDEDRPFIIESGKAETRVLGTSFNICAYPGQENVRIDVTSGRVEFKSTQTASQQVLVAHEAAVCMRNGEVQMLKANEVSEAEWMQGKLVFRKTPLKDAVVRIEKHYDLDFSLDKEVEDMLLNTTYPVADFSEEMVLNNIRTTLEVKLDIKDGGQVHITK